MSDKVRAGWAGSVPIDDRMLKKLQTWEAAHMPRREMQRRTGISTRRLALVLGRRERVVTGKPRPLINIYAYRRPFRMAAKRARELGYLLTSGENTSGGSVGRMVEAIGNGEVVVLRRDEYAALLSAVHGIEVSNVDLVNLVDMSGGVVDTTGSTPAQIR